jgi:hypothetical protein
MFRSYFAKLARHLRLHPLQFRELAAMAIYKRRTMNRTPKFMTVWPKDQKSFEVVSLPLGGFRASIFDDWHQEEYARILHFIAGCGMT